MTHKIYYIPYVISASADRYKTLIVKDEVSGREYMFIKKDKPLHKNKGTTRFYFSLTDLSYQLEQLGFSRFYIRKIITKFQALGKGV